MNSTPILDSRFTVRALNSGDIPTICHHRRAMYEEMGFAPSAIAAALADFPSWLAVQIPQDRYFGFVLEADGAIAAGIGLLLLDWPPHPDHPGQPQRGYILNVYVERPYRRHRLASYLMHLGEEEFRRRGVHYLTLHASAEGRPVYEQLGWRASSEMVKRLDENLS